MSEPRCPSSSSRGHILVIAQRVPYPPNKGEKLRTYYQIRWLKAQGYELTIAVPTETPQDVEDLNKLGSHLGVDILWHELKPRPLRLSLGLLKSRSLSEANFYSSALSQKIHKTLQQKNIQAVMLTASSLYQYAADCKVPVVVDFMDIDSEKWRQYSEKSQWPMRWLYHREAQKVRQLEHLCTSQFNASFLISTAEITQFQEVHPDLDHEKVHILGNGINTQEFYPCQTEPMANKACETFLFVGVMDYEPNVEAVLWFCQHVWPKLHQLYPKAQFVIAGMNPIPSIEALSNQPGIVVTGFVEDILGYFHSADVFVAPFRMARGVQNKILQAFACGLPTISTQVGIEGIECTKGEHYLQANSADEFISAISTLQEDVQLRAKIGQNALTLIQEQFSWDARLSKLGQVMEKAILCEAT